MSCSVKFWDLDYALKCVRGTEATADKLRKAELVRAVGALTWFVKGLPQGVPLLEEVRSLAGRVQDGLDEPGTDDYVDHPLRALRSQPELTPYSYSASMVRAGAPRAGPPQPDHVAAYSFVPDTVLQGAGGTGAARAARVAAAAAKEVAAAAAALTDASQDHLGTRGGASSAGAGTGATVLAAAAVAAAEEASAAAAALATASQDSLLFTQEDEELPGFSLFDPDKTPAIPAGQGGVDVGGGVQEGGTRADLDEVSPPARINNDHLPAHCDVPIGAANDGSKTASAGTGPLAAGGTVGRTPDQLQGQVGAQTQGDSAGAKRPKKREVCLAVRRGDVCMDKGCPKEHPARCGDPLCFPTWCKGCQLWHVRAGQGQGRPSQQQQGRQQRQQQQRSPQARGNDAGVNPGRAGLQKSQGRRPHPLGKGRLHHQHQRQQGHQQQQQQQLHRQGWLRQQQHHPPRPLWQPPVWQQQQQQVPPPPAPPWLAAGPSFRDVVKGATGRHSLDQAQLLDRLAALERKLAELVGSYQPSHGMSQI